MDNAIKTAKLALLVCLAVLCVCVADTLRHVRQSSDALTLTLGSVNQTVTDADRTVLATNAALNTKGGILDIVKATALHADRAVGEAAITSRQQRVAAAQLDTDILGTVNHVNVVMDSLAGNIRATTEDVHNSLIRVPALVDATNATVTSANRVLSNSDIPATLANIDAATKEINTTLVHVSGVTANLNAMSADLNKSLHKTLNPSRKSVALGWGLTALKIGAATATLF
jgi:uncharacterized protein YoxC